MGLTEEKRFLLFWSILGALALLLIWHLPWRFQVNDDEVMMWLVSGAYTGTPESYAVFLHPLLSWLFSNLYHLIPAIPWYPIVWFLTLYSSFLVFANLVSKRNQLPELKYLWVLFAFTFLIHFLFFLQFTVVAAFAITMGLAARFHREKPLVFSVYPEDFLILFGFLVRPEVLILFLVGMLIVKGLIFRDKLALKRIIIPALIWVFGLVISWIWLEANGLQRFQEINQLRSEVFDHPVLQLHKEEIKEIDPELYYFSNGLIDFQADLDLNEKLPAWKKYLDHRRFELLTFDSVLIALGTFVIHEHFLLGWMGIFLIFSFFRDWKRAGLLFLLIIGILIMATPFFLIKVQIYGILFLFFFLTVFLSIHSHHPVRFVNLGFLSVLCMAVLFHFYSFFQSPKNLISAEKLSLEIEELHSTGQIYLVGKGENYRDLLFDQPLGFKILGWPTLLENQLGIEKPEKNFYFVDSVTYSGNMKYFEGYVPKDTQTSLIFLIQK